MYSILALFTRDSAKLVCASYALALPLIWFGIHTWLQTFAFHISMEWIIFIVPPISLLAVSIVVVLAITLKAALANPVNSLRSE